MLLTSIAIILLIGQLANPSPVKREAEAQDAIVEETTATVVEGDIIEGEADAAGKVAENGTDGEQGTAEGGEDEAAPEAEGEAAADAEGEAAADAEGEAAGGEAGIPEEVADEAAEATTSEEGATGEEMSLDDEPVVITEGENEKAPSEEFVTIVEGEHGADTPDVDPVVIEEEPAARK
ncbi:unnamed protein product [Strongylus vulgaris]|uniref:Uncharacterized protein n=1 Tax=Strongylus vulgaris TaxID=40348 RepID=A0A3P7JII2_STRVU|nr:unnamed protein product [Strongylus vulgaris]